MLWLHAQIDEMNDLHREYITQRLGREQETLPSEALIREIRCINGFYDYLITQIKLREDQPCTKKSV